MDCEPRLASRRPVDPLSRNPAYAAKRTSARARDMQERYMGRGDRLANKDSAAEAALDLLLCVIAQQP
jgi:hypothetical protein